MPSEQCCVCRKAGKTAVARTDSQTGLSFVGRIDRMPSSIQSLLPAPAKFKILNRISRACNCEGFLQTFVDVVAH
jgi:hypothetical protein